MRNHVKIIGYVICDSKGHYPLTPEFGLGCLTQARAEARSLNHDFAEELGDGVYTVMALFDNGGAERVV